MKSDRQAVTLSVTIERKQPTLPRFVVIPASRLAAWSLTETTAVEVAIDGQAVDRRTIKPWDAARWFMSITEADCRRLHVDTGDAIRVVLRVADAALPSELARLLKADGRARAAWARLTPSQQRMLAENVRAAKQRDTRARRARAALVS